MRYSILKKRILKQMLNLVAFWCSLLFTIMAFANPQGGNVVSGKVVITSPSANTMEVKQSSQKAIVNWQSFNVSHGQSVNFQEPNSSSIILNRVNPNDGVSAIFGTIKSNGQVWLINSAGVWFGSSAYVNVAGLLVTSSMLSNQNFMNGNYQFHSSGNWNGVITNQGDIVVHLAGLAALVGPEVVNNGNIQANMGTIVLGATKEFTVDFNGDQLINFAVGTQPIKPQVDAQGHKLINSVTNTGALIANGGKILLSANTAGSVLDSVINLKGVAEANTVGTHKGEIILSANSTNGVVTVSGNISASGKKAGQTGGTVEITGNDILLDSTANINVSGNAGGGNIFIGGNAHGTGLLPDATATVMMPGAILNASAINNGNGGNVVLWSNQYTLFGGTILAEGGTSGGNGGYVETSSHNILDVSGNVNASAPNGLAGNWLLDPYNVTITASTTSNGSFNGLSPNVFTPSGNSADVSAATIDTSLNGGTSVTITTGSSGSQGGTLNVSSPISTSYVGVTLPTLTLNSAGTLTIGSAIGYTGSGLNVTLISGGTITESAGKTITATTLNTSSATGQTLAQNNAVSTFNATNSTSGNISFTNTSPLTISGISQTGNGTVSVTNTGSITTTGTVNTTGTGTITLTANGTGSNISLGANVSGDALSMTSTGPISQTAGSLIASGTSSFNAGANAISLTDSGNALTGAITLSNSGANNVSLTNSIATVLAASTIGLNLTINSSGAITQTGALTVAGTASFTAGANPITLTTATNALTGAVTFSNSGSNNVSFTNNIATSLAASTIGQNLTINSGGAITQTGALIVPGTASFTAGAHAITLSNAGNSFTGAVALSNSGANNVALTNYGALTLGTIGIGSGILTIDSTAGGLTSGAITDTANAITQAASAGTASFTAGAGAITLTDASNSLTGAVAFSNNGSNNVSFTNSRATSLAASTIGQNLTITSVGAITQTGALTVPGTANFTAGAHVITLTNAGNSFTGAITLSNSGANAISVTNNTATTLAASTIGQNLTITSTGAITQTGALTVPGTASFTAGANAITLTNAANSFTGAVAFSNSSSNNVSFTNNRATSLAASTIGQNLTITSVGAITQTGALTVPGTASFSSGAYAMTLTNAANLFTGAITLSNSGAHAISLTNNTATTLAASTIGQNLTINSAGAITQTGALTVPGTASFTAGANGITLTNAANLFTGAITLSNSGSNAISITNNTATSFAASTIGQNLTINSAGAITQTGALTVPGTASFTAGANAITLTTAANLFTGAITLSNSGSNAISITNNKATSLAASTIGQNLTINSAGAITQTGALTVPGTASFTAGANAITLTNVGNSFTGAVALSNSGANNVALTNYGALTLGTVGVGSGTLTIDSTAGGLTSGAITDTANAITQSASAGIASFTAGTGAITLTNSNNDFVGTVSLSNSGANDVSLTNGSSNVLLLGSMNIGRNLTINGGVGVTEVANAAINAGGTININANTGGTNGINDFLMNVGSSITSSGGIGSIISILVNTTVGRGTATLGNMSDLGGTIAVSTTGSTTTSAGNSSGGSITQNAGTTLNAGTNGTFNLFVPTSNSSGIGTAGTNITTSAAGGTLNLEMGTGGAYVTNTGNLTLGAPTVTAASYPLSVISTGSLTLPAYNFSTGSGALTFESTGGTLNTNGTLTTGNATLTLIGSNGLTIGNAVASTGTGSVNISSTAGDVVVNSSGSVNSTSGPLTLSAFNNVNISGDITANSGTILINANQGSGAGNFILNPGGSISTSNHGASAIGITVNTASGGTGSALLGGNILVGNLATLTISTTGVLSAIGGNTTGGSIIQSAGIIGSANNANISLFVPSTGSSGISGVSGVGGNAISTQTTGGTLTLTAGSAGAFDLTSGSTTLALPALQANSPLTVVATGTLTLPATAIATGTANLDLESDGGTLSTAANLSTTSGNLTLVSADGLTINNTLSTNSGNILLNNTSSGTLTLAAGSAINATSGTGDTIILTTPAFTNEAGSSAINPGTGNFLIWSQNLPTSDILDGLVYNFKQYNAVYGSSTVLGVGNGVLYTIAPVITAALNGVVSKVYDATTTATLSSANYSSSGAIDGDTVILNNPASGTYSNQNVGNNINVAVSGIAVASATNGNVAVYGYQMASTTANATIGVITPATLIASLTGTVSKVYNNTTNAVLSPGNYLLSGVYGNDNVTFNNPVNGTYGSANVGNAIPVTVSGLAINGSAAHDYRLAATMITGNIGAITPAVSNVPSNLVAISAAQNILLPRNQNSAASTTNLTIENNVDMNTLISPTFAFNAANSTTYLSSRSFVKSSRFGIANKHYSQLVDENSAGAAALVRMLQDIQVMLLLFAAVSIAAELKATARLKGRLRYNLSTISFKLRSALDIVIGFAHLMHNGNVGMITQEQKEFLDKVLAQSNTLVSEVRELEVESSNPILDAQALARISFKLRTALNGIIGFTSIISYGQVGEITPQQKEFLDNILAASNQILQLIPNNVNSAQQPWHE